MEGNVGKKKGQQVTNQVMLDQADIYFSVRLNSIV